MTKKSGLNSKIRFMNCSVYFCFVFADNAELIRTGKKVKKKGEQDLSFVGKIFDFISSYGSQDDESEGNSKDTEKKKLLKME